MGIKLLNIGKLIYKSFQFFLSGLYAIESKINVGSVTFSYLDSGDLSKDIVLLIHGFCGNKWIWANEIRNLKKKYRVIAMDLIGHGESSSDIELNYSPESHAKYIMQFLRFIKTNNVKINIVGLSMGGLIAEKIIKLSSMKFGIIILINPFGSSHHQMVTLPHFIQDKTNPFLYQNIYEFHRFLSFVYYTPPYIPIMTKLYFVNEAKIKHKLISKMLHVLIESDPMCMRVLNREKTHFIFSIYDLVIDPKITIHNLALTKSDFTWIKSGHVPLFFGLDSIFHYQVD